MRELAGTSIESAMRVTFWPSNNFCSTVITHALNVSPDARLVRQKKRKFSSNKIQAIKKETEKLLKIRFIREVQYLDWLSNVVMVKKASGKWMMCVDFTNLNKACPKETFPVIDRPMDASVGHNILNFMDAFLEYNQISMDLVDQENTTFITKEGLYCYRVMPFGLKNTGATYQHLVNKVFADKIGQTMEVYVNDMLVKSSTIE